MKRRPIRFHRKHALDQFRPRIASNQPGFPDIEWVSTTAGPILSSSATRASPVSFSLSGPAPLTTAVGVMLCEAKK